MLIIPREICINIDEALNREWLVANGIGGYASSSIVGANTRRYHGLLVAAMRPPVERTVLLAKIDEEAEIDGRTYYLGVNEYPDGKIHPGGFVHIEEFRLEDGIPTTVFRLGDSVLHKTVWMEHDHNTTYVRYTYVKGSDECSLVLHPMCNHRDYHQTTRGALGWDFGVEPLENGCRVQAKPELPPFWLTGAPGAGFTHTGVWYWNFVYRGEVARGYPETEDLYLPGIFRATLQPGESFTIIASMEPPDATGALLEGALERERERQGQLLTAAGISREAGAASPDAGPEALAAQLVRAAGTFIVARNLDREGTTTQVPTVLAGYHWFTDWGRDTMISLPGLTLPTGRTREANRILRTFGLFARDGLIPNNFPDAGAAPHYNTVDATLWLFAAVERLAEGTGNMNTARDLYPLLADMVAWHVRGTRYGIKMDPEDGLLYAGEPGVQLTWMDAKVDDWVVTARTGKPVEINALWYNALRVMEKLRVSLGRTVVAGRHEPPNFKELAELVRYNFRKRFWFDVGDYLFDVIDGPDGNDISIRPNQVFAVSLRNDLLSVDQARRALAVVREHLLTPYGLRSLSPQDPQYKKEYVGDRRERDGAYHNGTVWTWLAGPYLDAVRQVEGIEAARNELRAMLPAWAKHLFEAGLGTISEIFDADPPHEPKGCISQAWSVAEVLRQVWGPNSLL
ncbi:MAG: glycogen debranching enzyme N-terminal domain-containing protein [Chloroflexota bacterium]|nr:glycogen debranching enzyme N-terminal domain-containing protein [Chloroflexota bacterium]